jgi:acetyltransferase-like isoleucine patch superfamily enzyme
VKSSYLFRGVKLAHFNFVGDSVIGADTNIEAGAVIANHRNEWRDPRIVLVYGPRRIETGATKFGAIIGDRSRIGANAVLAPGTLLPPDSLVPRLALVDQHQPAEPRDP